MIIIIQRIFASYRKPIFDLIAATNDITVLHGKNESGINQITARYSCLVDTIKYGPKETQIYIKTIKPILRLKPEIVIHEFTPSILSLAGVFILSRFLKFKLILWGHGYNHTKGFRPNKSLSAALRLFYLKRADAIIVYGFDAKNLLSRYINPEKIFVAPNTLDTSSLIKIKKEFDKAGKEIIRNGIGFKHKYNILFIGRLLKNKHPELLIDIYERIRDELSNDIGVHYIGDGELTEYLLEVITEKGYSDNVFLHGPINEDNLNGKYLYSSDIMVMPGYVGLSVNHAFCFGCPVITFAKGVNGPFHSPEIEYLVNNKTGFQIQKFDVNEMSRVILSYLTNQNLQIEIKRNINNTINNVCSIDKMLKGFQDCFDWVKGEIK